jgi:isovaleryl-CoA dehydrogenase
MIHPINFQLSDTTIMLRDAVKQFADKEISPLAQEIDATNLFPRQLWPKLGKMGLLGITVDESYGGANMRYIDHVIAMEEISRASGSIGLSYGAHSNLCVNQLHSFGTESQKKQYLEKLITGEHVGALAISEVGSGSDAISMRLTAVDKGDHFVLNGNKMWITNGPEADVIIVYAKTQPDAGSRGISAFIIEKHFPGFSTAQKLDKLGMRGSDTCELVFKNCQVPKQNILGSLNEGVKVMMSGLNIERVILAAGPIGIMQACLDLVLPYIHERKQFGHPIGDYQLVQAMVADIYTQLNASRAFLYAIAHECDLGRVCNRDAASVILFAAENATQTALKAIQCLGGNGYINEYAAGRLLRDAKLYEIGAGTSEIRRIIIGKELFKETR